ncbi:hypothetical protein EZY14_016030 [Kordia sp. TARA_039_SRF]|jgi:hypothetical protein|nr:hypothetical protein EZY14_016030 [Kordia sp. TARA_039_SRF]
MKKQLKNLSLSKKTISDLNTLKSKLGGDGRTDPNSDCNTIPLYCKVKTEFAGCPKPPVLKTINTPTCD